jgi:hypothetical protein
MLYENYFYFCSGEMAEWSIAAVLKTVVPLPEPGVRIPLSPPSINQVYTLFSTQ